MSFTTLFFLIVFLPLYLVLYTAVPGIKRKNAVLLLFSLIFYAFGGIEYLLLMIAEAAITWGAGLLLLRKADDAIIRKRVMIAVIALLAAVLILFKYTGFVIGSVTTLFHIPFDGLKWVMPLGISFYTFKLIAYIADCYTNKIRPERQFMPFLLYVCTFHHVLQGPILRFSDIRRDIYRRKFFLGSLTTGLYRFCLCLAMKTLLADPIGQLAAALAPTDAGIAGVSTSAMWLSSICFSLQLYLDFAAYSGMAIGLGEMIGFHYMENFNYPYIATSVKDFWRRWHISLSLFFRDYVYIPLGGNRVNPKRTILNLLVVWLLTGIWHGAAWNFILWGLYYFAFVCLENYVIRLRKLHAPKDAEGNPLPDTRWMHLLKRIGGHIYTILVFNLGWVLFRFTSFSSLGKALKAYFGFGAASTGSTTGITMKNHIFLLLFCLLAATPFFKQLDEWIEGQFEARKISKNYLYGARTVLAAVLFLFSLFAISGNTYTPFLYNQF